MRFLDESAERPVDLASELESGADASALADRLEAELCSARDPDDRELVSALARELRAARLPLPPMPESVVRVQRLLDAPDCRIQDLAAEVERDPALSTKLVGIANSPFYAGMEPVNGVRDAIVRIGMRETRNIAWAIALRSRVLRAPGHEREIDALWRHALAASIATRVLAAELALDPDRGFLGGLVHDVGRAVLLAMFAEMRARTRGARRPSSGLLERLSASLHAPLGGLVAQSWRFPADLAGAIAYHHEPAKAPPEAKRMAQALQLGDLLARRIAPDVSLEPPAPPDDSDFQGWLEAAGLELESWAALEAEAAEAFESLKTAL